ncbi:hypothetical protein NUSPORA_01200 [Nucleospora cyclopteri]
MLSNSADLICVICKEVAVIKAVLPCNCFFCFNCINRHLKQTSFCPKCYKVKFSFFDIICKEEKKRKVIKIIAKSESLLRRELKKHSVNNKGPLNRLKWRYNELLCILETESYREKSKPRNKIAWEIHKKETSVFRDKKNKNTAKIRKKAGELKEKMLKKIS